MTAGFCIEPMRERHVDEVLAIEAELFDSPWPAEMFLNEIGHHLSRSTVATLDGVVVGYTIAWFVRGEVHLLNVGVARAHQRRGFGRRMVRSVIDCARRERCRLVTLEVRETNHAARALYESFGFVPIGVRRGYYEESGTDAVVMLLELGKEDAEKGAG